MNSHDMDPADPGASDDTLSRRMHDAARTVGAGADLPPAAGVRARGTQRRRRRTTGLVAAAALAVVGVVTGTSLLLGTSAAPPSPATGLPSVTVSGSTSSTTDPTAAPTESTPPSDRTPSPTESAPSSDPETSMPTESADLLAGGRSFDLFAPDGRWLAPNVEGGVSLVAEPDPAGVATSWLIVPVSDGRVRLETVTTADGRPLCLQVRTDGIVGLGTCADTEPTQLLAITLSGAAGTAPTMTLASGDSFMALVDGQLTATTDPVQATAFTAVDRGAFDRPAG